MKILCIYGCGGMGREVADLAYRINDWKKIVFVDDNIKSRVVDELEVFTLEEVMKQFERSNLEFIVATGEPSSIQFLYEKLEKNNLEPASVRDPNFILSNSSSIDRGSLIHIGATLTVNVHIGKGCIINTQVNIGHDVSVGDYTVISPNVSIGGDVNIGSNCYLGSGAIIRNGINIGDNSIIGMGSVVLKDVKANSVMVGNPAKLLKINIDKKVFK